MFQCSTNFYSKADVSPMALVLDHKVLCMKHPACSMTSCKRESTVLSMVMAPFWQAKTCGAAVQQSFHSMEKLRNSKQLHSLPNFSPQCLYLLHLLYSTHSICWQYQSAMCFCSFLLSTSKMHACHNFWQQRCMLKDRNQSSVPAW